MSVAKLYACVQLVPAFLAGRWWAVAAVLAATLLFGRVYCRFVCPLGIAQSAVRLFRGPRRVCTRLRGGYGGRARIAVNAAVLALFLAVGLAGLGWQWLDPYAIASRAACFAAAAEFDPAVAAFALLPAAVILLLAVFAGGRLWCNWVCPAGTLFSLLSTFSWRKDKVDRKAGCTGCGRCFAKAPAGGARKEDGR